MADFKTRGNVAVAGGVTGARDLISSPSILRWAAEGKVFSAGLAPDDTAIDSAAALDDTTPTFGIKAPASAALYIVPIFTRMSLTGDGGGYGEVQAAVTKAAADCVTAFTLTGTAIPTRNHNTNLTTPPQAKALYTCTASQLTNTDVISMLHVHHVDATLTTGLPLVNKENLFEMELLQEAWLLSAGAALLFYCYTGTTDSTWRPYLTWAELTIDDLH